MTGDEALKQLKIELSIWESDCKSYHKTKDALKVAIKALEQEPKYCDRNICTSNEYNGIGCEECEVTKSREYGKEKVLDKIRAEIVDTLYVDSLIFGELIDFKNGKISADDVIEEFNRVTRIEVLKIIDKYKAESEG